MKIIRYSKQGFNPQDQTYHLKDVDYHLNHFDINLFPDHLKRVILERHEKLVKLYKENLDDFKRGIWVFIDGHKNNQALNHLKCKVPCFEAEIDDDIEVYGVNWDCKLKISDPVVEAFGCYIPERELKTLRNIKRRVKRV